MPSPSPEPPPADRSLPPNAIHGGNTERSNVWVTGSLAAGQSDPKDPRVRRRVETVERGQIPAKNHERE